MKTLGIIPARFTSSRFPGKPLVDIGGVTMIERVYKQASKCKLLSALVVATDDIRIFDEVKRFGGRALMTSERCHNGTERCGEVVKQPQYEAFDVVVNIQGDEPFIDPQDIDNLISTFENPETEISTLVRAFDDPRDINLPSRVKAVIDASTMQARWFQRGPYMAAEDEKVMLHVGLYAFRLSVLNKLLTLNSTPAELAENLEQLRWIENDYKIQCVVTDRISLSVDTPEDLDTIRKTLLSK